MFLQQWKSALWELKFHNFSSVCKKHATLTHHALEGPLEYDRKVYCFHVLIVHSWIFWSASLSFLKFFGRFLYITATGLMLLNVSLKNYSCKELTALSPRIALIFSTQLEEISTCILDFSGTMYNVCVHPNISICGWYK